MKKYILTSIILLLSAVVNTTWAQIDINDPSITVTVEPATYTGTAITPIVTVSGGSDLELEVGTDYNISFDATEYINAKTYSNAITITGIGNYAGTRKADFTIAPRNINDVTVEGHSLLYTGTAYTTEAIANGISLTYGDNPLTKGTSEDYTVTVTNGTYKDPGTYSGVITLTAVEGVGKNFVGSRTIDFIITPNNAINLASAAVVISKQTYTGADLKPTAATTTVTVNGTALSSDYYDFSFVPEGDNFYKDAKVYSNAIIITAKSTQTTYYGTAVGNYIIEPRDLSDADVIVTATDIDYNNTEHPVTVTVKYGENVIPATNYTFDPTKVTEAGTYTITVNAVENSNLVGSTTTTLLVKKSLEGTYADDFTVDPSSIPTQTVTGSQITPTIVLKDKDRVMTPNVDYTVSYGTNTDEGEGTITITGTGAYSGTKAITFTIVNEYFTVDNITYHHANEGEEVSVGKKDGANNVPATGDKTGKVEVPETVDYQGKTFTVTGIEEKALGGADITAVVLPQSIAEIEDNAFQGAINTRYIDATAMSGYVPETLTRDFDGPFGGLPKQALVYLTGTNIKGENYVYKPGSGDAYYCELFKIYDDLNGSQTGFDGNDYKWAFENVHKFTAYTVENTRVLAADKHYTTCLPYTLAIPAGMKAYTLDATSGKLFGFSEVTGIISAFTPYVLILSKSGQLLSTTNVEVDVFTDATQLISVTPTNSSFTLFGTMRYIDGTNAAGKYIMQYKDNKSTWLSIDVDNAGYDKTNRACILPMRAYIAQTTPTVNPSPARSYTATFTDIDGIIRTETFTLDDEDTVIYDLQGRKVQGELQRGVYIVNGKKVMVK